LLKELLNNLHSEINKDPQQEPAFAISGVGAVAVIQNDTLQLTGPSSAQYNLRSYSLGSLAEEINNQSGFTATYLQPASFSAVVLLDGTYTDSITIPMFTSFLWQLFKPVALALVDALGAENRALLEMVLNTSDGSWLDAFGELFGVHRQDGEPDQLFAIRIFDFSVAPRINNMAIQKSLMDLGYNATVTDTGPAAFEVTVILPNSPPQGFYYSSSQIDTLVGLLKAAGTTAAVILSGSLTDGIDITDSISATTTEGTWTWDNFVWGQFTWTGG
jgi:hypothetical protein